MYAISHNGMYGTSQTNSAQGAHPLSLANLCICTTSIFTSPFFPVLSEGVYMGGGDGGGMDRMGTQLGRLCLP